MHRSLDGFRGRALFLQKFSHDSACHSETLHLRYSSEKQQNVNIEADLFAQTINAHCMR